MRCLNCHKKLVKTDGDIYFCGCGLKYSGDLIKSADRIIWVYLMLTRRFTLDCTSEDNKTIFVNTDDIPKFLRRGW